MLKKIDAKLNKEIDKLIEREDLTIADVKILTDIRNSIAMQDVIDKGFAFGLANNTKEIEGGE